MSETKYQNFEMITMDVKILKEELKAELKKSEPDESYIEEILNYGAWGDDLSLHFFAKYGYVKGIKNLLEEGANPNIQRADGDTALHWASSEGHLQVVEEILKHPLIDPNVKTAEGDTALHWASCNGHSQVVQALLSHPQTDPNVQNECGNTVLHWESNGGLSQVVQALLDHPKTDITITNDDDRTAWDSATPKIREQFPQLKP